MIASRSKHDGFRGEQDEDSRKRDLTMPLKRFLGPSESLRLRLEFLKFRPLNNLEAARMPHLPGPTAVLGKSV
jgi:hypothetical protein